MPRCATGCVVGLAIILAVLGPAPGARAQRPDGPAMEAFRRQATERERRRAALLDAIRAIPEPPAAPPNPVFLRLVPLPGGRVVLDDDEEPPDDEEAPPDRPRNVLAPENFDFRIFNELISDEARRARMEEALDLLIDRAAAVHGLKAAERTRLRLAGRGDIKHFFDRLAEARRAFDRVRRDAGAGLDFLNQIRLQDPGSFGAFGDDSLFAKTLARTLRDRRPAR